MSPREKLQLVYEIAFFPPRLDEMSNGIRRGDIKCKDAAELIDLALSLHQALPDDGYASQRALQRLARYQADSRMFGTVKVLRSLRRKLGRKGEFRVKTVPGHMVRDIGLPPFCRPAAKRHSH